MRPGFEGSYLGADAKITDRAVMECKICWNAYDPALGDETRQMAPGTPFRALPPDWTCPHCDAPKAQFMVLDDPGAADERAMAAAVARLEAEFREIHNAKMRETPLVNKALSVEAVGFRPWQGRLIGVLVTPWFMNLTLLPGPGDDWSGLATGTTEEIAFPSGTYAFLHAVRAGCGGYKGCSLFSPMTEFGSQLHATDTARAVMEALFDERNRVDACEAEKPAPPTSRRAVISAGMAAP